MVLRQVKIRLESGPVTADLTTTAVYWPLLTYSPSKNERMDERVFYISFNALITYIGTATSKGMNEGR